MVKADLYNGPDEDDVLSDDDSYKLSVVLVYSLAVTRSYCVSVES